MNFPEARLTVLTFHGVVDDGYENFVRNRTGKHIPAGRFREIINELAGRGILVSLDSLDHLDDLPQNAFALTFDDGFANVLRNAVPLLRRYGVPATFFINPQFCYASNHGNSWADLLEQHYAAADIEPATALEELQHHRSVVRTCPYIDPYRYANWVLNGETSPADPQLDPKLTWAQVQELAADPLFTIGGHGDNHRILTHLTDDELEEDVGTCLSDLLIETGLVTLFSYPDGRHNPKVVEALKRHRITHAFTTQPGTWAIGDDPYRIPRVKAA